MLVLTPSEGSTGGASRLESGAVSAPTSKDYATRFVQLKVLCAAHCPPLVSVDDLDKALLESFNTSYPVGKPLDTGTKLLAAVGHR